jgi:hypothetical protein
VLQKSAAAELPHLADLLEAALCLSPPPSPRWQEKKKAAADLRGRRRLLKKISPDLQLPTRLHLGGSSERLTGEHPMPRLDTGVTVFREEKPGGEGAKRAEATPCHGSGQERSA